jgi:crotonobetainyl-CoA:carnitine CoA-transferase CaiB-like acyl-CoA transferase
MMGDHANTVAGPLSGIRVVELTTAWAGPMAGRALAFLGAELIQLESPTRVNSWRLNKEAKNPVNFPDRNPGAQPYDRSFLFNSQNVNKRSLILDLKATGAIEVLRELLAKTDVLICNFRPAMLRRMGLDYDHLKLLKPDIIVAEMPAFGIEGPMADYAALGPTMEMAAGMSSMIGYQGGGPVTTGPSYMDPIGGFNCAAAILTALIHRQATGEGQHIEIPQVEAGMQFIGEEILAAIIHGQDPEPNGNHVRNAAPHDAYAAEGEDSWVAIAVTSDEAFKALCTTIGEPDLVLDPRYATFEERYRNQDLLREPITRWTRTQSKHAAAVRLQAAGVAAAPVQSPKDVAESAHLAHTGFFTELTHPDAGRHPHPGLPFRLSATPGGQRRAAPTFGQDTHAILTTVLGLGPEAIADLERSGAVASAPLPGA